MGNKVNRICSRCNVEYPNSDFTKGYNICHSCQNKVVRDHYALHPEKKKASGLKWRKANKDKIREASRKYHDAHAEEIKKKKNEYYKFHPDKRTKKNDRQKSSTLKLLYGITLEEYNELFEKQNGRCAICGNHRSESKRNFDVDHNHKTGKVRGLLCRRCNSGLGLFGENTDIFEKAIDYLVYWKLRELNNV